MAKRDDRHGKRNRDKHRAEETPEVSARSGVSEQHHDLLSTLMRELFQTEKSASLHPVREAERLGDIPPSHAFRRVAAHASDILDRLPDLARVHDLPVSQAGKSVGAMFSNVRELVADRLIDPERSYRGTLLGMRHGIDLVTLMRSTARVAGDEELASWCGVWLDERIPLVDLCAEQLAWFASHPAEARRSRALFPQSLFAAFEKKSDGEETRELRHAVGR